MNQLSVDFSGVWRACGSGWGWGWGGREPPPQELCRQLLQELAEVAPCSSSSWNVQPFNSKIQERGSGRGGICWDLVVFLSWNFAVDDYGWHVWDLPDSLIQSRYLSLGHCVCTRQVPRPTSCGSLTSLGSGSGNLPMCGVYLLWRSRTTALLSSYLVMDNLKICISRFIF